MKCEEMEVLEPHQSFLGAPYCVQCLPARSLQVRAVQ